MKKEKSNYIYITELIENHKRYNIYFDKETKKLYKISNDEFMELSSSDFKSMFISFQLDEIIKDRKNKVDKKEKKSAYSFLLIFESVQLIFLIALFCYAKNYVKNVKIIDSKIEKYYEEDYQELLINYQEYIKLIAEEIKIQNPDRDIIQDFATYRNMLKGGYLSKGDVFYYKIPEFEFEDYFGINVISGSGVCRNVSDHMAQVFNILGYNSTVVCGEVYQSGEKHYITNHALVYVENENMKISYLLDPTNDTIFLRDKDNIFRSIYDYSRCFELNSKSTICSYETISTEDMYDQNYQLSNEVREKYGDAIYYNNYKIFYADYELNSLESLENTIYDSYEYCLSLANERKKLN